METRSSYHSCWWFFGMTAQSCICTPSHQTRFRRHFTWRTPMRTETPGHRKRGACNLNKELYCSQRLPGIPPEVVVVPIKDFSTIITAPGHILIVLQSIGLKNLMSRMIHSWTQIGRGGPTYTEPLSAESAKFEGCISHNSEVYRATSDCIISTCWSWWRSTKAR